MNVYAPVFQVQARAVIVRSVAMKFKASKKRNNGFTLVEMLAVTAIVAILLAIGIVAVVYYARWLHITELDNTAREIYLAAENRAVLLSAGGRLEEQVKAAAGGAEQTVTPPDKDKSATPLAAGGGAANAEYRYIYYSGSANQLEDLLPVGTIDPALREGYFYIVYEVNMGSVTDVFYAEDGNLLDNNNDFQDFYETWRGSSRQKRLDEKRMIGYYGGEAAGNDKTDALRAPILRVFNEEELWVELSYEVPTGETRTPQVRLYHVEGENKKYEIDLSDLSGWTKTTTTGINGTTYTYTRVLDSLETGKQFQNLYQNNSVVTGEKPASFGWDFTVEAWTEGGTVRSTSAYDTGNSLFASRKEEGDGDGPVAYIGNLRHLQNLDEEFSKVEDKTVAVQIADIEQSSSELDYYRNYEFKPIKNSELKSYCGSYGANEADSVVHFIKGLTVTAASVTGKPAGGLFATVQGSEGAPWKFKDVRLINTRVKMIEEGTGQSLPAGALVGQAGNASFDGCWVYWEGEALETLKASIIPETGLEDMHYQITGSSAGGLVGELSGGTIKDCFAATLVKGTSVAGGLVGMANDTVIVQNSYADCYLTASNAAAGLIGTTNGTVNFTNVYAAGFVDNAKKNAAGLCCKREGASVTVTAQNAYSAMHYKNTGENVIIVPLAEDVTEGDNSHCYFLQYSNGTGGSAYEDMIKVEFLTKVNNGGNNFEWKYSDSYPYSLLMNLTAYPFPGLVGLPHYGDWNAEFVKPALVYFEKYKPIGGGTDQYGFYVDGVDTLKKDTEIEGKYTVPLDGYAVAFREEDLGNNNADLTITFTYYDQDGNEQQLEQKYHKNGSGIHDTLLKLEDKNDNNKTYYLAILPDGLINRDYASKNFYQRLSFQVKNDPTTTWAAYCPHFAKTARPISEGMTDQELANMAKQARGYVRTPRHLRALSQFETYAYGGKIEEINGKNTWVSHTYTYIQELDLDYTAYEGYNWAGSWDKDLYTQEPIGKFGAPFNGNYNGGCHTIQNVKFKLPEESARQYAGLFGLSAGNLQNIVYLVNPKETISVARTGVTLYLGALAGGSSGTITNCAVAGADLQGTIYNKAEAYVGGLVGINNGAIQNCAAEVASLKTRGEDFSTARAGGLVGRNNGTIRTSYAVGHISGEAQNDSSARVCGFVGYNTGTISYSYTAAWLESSGAGVETFGFCGERLGSQDHTYFVDSGNFTYREEPYNGTYSTGTERATPISYRVMTGGELAAGEKKPELVDNGMNQGGTAKKGNEDTLLADQFPLPTGVTKNGEPVHYGQWPEELDLGLMGIYYWEKMELPGGNGVREIYGVSMLKVDPSEKTVEKISTLSNARSDGGKVVDYGYGYYATNNRVGEVKFETEGIHHTEEGKTAIRDPYTGQLWELYEQEEEATEGESKTIVEVNEALNNLMEEYTFFSFRSFVPNPTPGTEGFVKGETKDGMCTVKRPNGIFTVSLEPDDESEADVRADFYLNPHFADAMGVQEVGEFGYDEKGHWALIGWKYDQKNVLGVEPGTEANPYEVRAMGQLSAINWNSENLDTKTVIDGESNNTQFPYLSYGGHTRDYVWVQTHDIHGNSKTYTPIAEYYDYISQPIGRLAGWFGGSFNGDDYVIENVNIQGQTSSVAGLFGVVFNGSLRNIVLYSSDGAGTISNTDKSGVNHTKSLWYSMGTLAGIAAAKENADGYKGNVVENCSASGYTIQYGTYNKVDNGAANDGKGGGSTIGGLLGSSDMALKNCTAATKIQIFKGKATKTLGNDNLRAGGLTGVCQNAITNCYVGGSIKVENGVIVKSGNALYLGGIVGGGYFKPLSVKGANKGKDIEIGGGGSGVSGSATLTNCYSYVELPSKSTTVYTTQGGFVPSEDPAKGANEDKIKALYAIGGQGDGDTDYSATNCYYLESEVMKNNLNGFSGVNATDIPYVGRTVTLSDGSTRTLTPDNVGDIYDVSPAVYRNFYSNVRVNTGGTEITIRCRIQNSNVVGEPLFVFVDENNEYFDNGSQAPGSVRARFLGWIKTPISGGGGSCEVTNDPTMFYSDPMPLTYKQLAGTDQIEKNGEPQDIYDLLPDFDPVTDTEDGFAVPGKYSYNTKMRPELQGLRYPFPTILTRDADGKRVHVHYGDWPLNGIERVTGGAPIRLDLLKVGGEVKAETLTLSAEVPEGGTWKIEKKTPAEGEQSQKSIIEAYLGDVEGNTTVSDNNRSCNLTVKGLELGQTEVTVVYEKGDVEYGRVTITVNVTATLRVRSEFSPIYVFPGAKNIVVPLVLCDDEWKELSQEKQADVEIDLRKSRCRWPEDLLSNAQLAGQNGDYYLILEAVDNPEEEKFNEPQAITVSVPYTYNGAEIEAEHSMLSVEMRPLPKPEINEETGVTLITFPEISLGKDQDESEITVVTTVKQAEVDDVKKPASESSDDQTTDPDTTEEPEGRVTYEDNVVSLENYAPGSEVTLELTLELSRSNATEGEQSMTQTVPMTAIILALSENPEDGDQGAENPGGGETNSEAKQAESQEAVQAAEPEQIQDPELPVGERAKLPEGPDPALPVEEKTDPVPEKDAGTGEDGTEPEQ